MVFFSYRTKHESQAGDQFWIFSRQCSSFGRIGNQWVAISNPGGGGGGGVQTGKRLCQQQCDQNNVSLFARAFMGKNMTAKLRTDRSCETLW